jgi:hypothetical protein
MTINEDDVNTIAGGGGEVRTIAGDRVGKIGQVYLDDESGRPSWVTVKTGLFGTQESFVPLPGADLEGVDVVVSYDKDTIKGAPRIDSDGSLTPQEEKLLYSYYFEASTLSSTEQRSHDSRDHDLRSSATAVGRSDRDRDDDETRDRNTFEDRSRRQDSDEDRRREDDREDADGDDAVGTPRLRKYVVTEKVVPVSREEMPVKDSDTR